MSEHKHEWVSYCSHTLEDGTPCDASAYPEELLIELATLRRERDEARAEAERLRALLSDHLDE